MQLTAYGAQDLYLTGEPEITLFKTVYRRHTPFSMEAIPQYFETNPIFSTTQRSLGKVMIERNADLMQDIYVVMDMPAIYSTEADKFQWINYLGENIIYSATVQVEGQVLDVQYSQWLHIWNQLTLTPGRRQSYNRMIGYTKEMTMPVYQGQFTHGAQQTIPKTRLYIPLPFWFCQNPGLTLPLIAMQYTQMQIIVEFTEINTWFTIWQHMNSRYFYEFAVSQIASTSPATNPTYQILQQINSASQVKAQTIVKQLTEQGYGPDNYFWKYVNGSPIPGGWDANPYLLVNYIYLDEDERKRFASVSHDYLFTQVQTSVFTGQQDLSSLHLVFQKPCREIIFALQRNDVDYTNEWNNYTNCLYYYPMDAGNFEFDISQYQQKVLLYDDNIQTCLNYIQPIEDIVTLPGSKEKILYAVQLLLNGQNRFTPLESSYFQNLQPFMYHSFEAPKGIYVYSFAEKPEEHQPSGTMNFSRFQRIQLNLKMRQVVCPEVTYNISVFVVNYEVFRVIGGIGSMVYAN